MTFLEIPQRRRLDEDFRADLHWQCGLGGWHVSYALRFWEGPDLSSYFGTLPCALSVCAILEVSTGAVTHESLPMLNQRLPQMFWQLKSVKILFRLYTAMLLWLFPFSCISCGNFHCDSRWLTHRYKLWSIICLYGCLDKSFNLWNDNYWHLSALAIHGILLFGGWHWMRLIDEIFCRIQIRFAFNLALRSNMHLSITIPDLVILLDFDNRILFSLLTLEEYRLFLNLQRVIICLYTFSFLISSSKFLLLGLWLCNETDLVYSLTFL